MMFQDLGRFGYGHLGVSQGGALDLHAYCWANYLLGNPMNSACVEIGVGNAVFLALEDVMISITGAEMNARVDGVEVLNWGSHVVRRGQTLKLGYARKGSYGYLAVQGGFCVEQVLGSGSTVVRNDIGRLLVDGDELVVGENVQGGDCQLREAKLTPSRFITDYDLVGEVLVIRVVFPVGQERGVSSALLDTVFRVSSESDRMGRNLIAEGELPVLDGIVSEGISIGCIQLPPGGNPIVLLNDRQTQGGYAKVGNVARVDLPLLVQARANTRLRFVAVSHEVATEEWVGFVRFFGL